MTSEEIKSKEESIKLKENNLKDWAWSRLCQLALPAVDFFEILRQKLYLNQEQYQLEQEKLKSANEAKQEPKLDLVDSK